MGHQVPGCRMRRSAWALFVLQAAAPLASVPPQELERFRDDIKARVIAYMKRTTMQPT